MLRVVLDPEQPGVVVPDPGRRLPGRGAWITPTIQALDLAEARRAFGRALRATTAVDAVLQTDPGYYAWIIGGDFPLNTKQKLTEIRMRMK